MQYNDFGMEECLHVLKATRFYTSLVLKNENSVKMHILVLFSKKKANVLLIGLTKIIFDTEITTFNTAIVESGKPHHSIHWSLSWQ